MKRKTTLHSLLNDEVMDNIDAKRSYPHMKPVKFSQSITRHKTVMIDFDTSLNLNKNSEDYTSVVGSQMKNLGQQVKNI